MKENRQNVYKFRLMTKNIIFVVVLNSRKVFSFVGICCYFTKNKKFWIAKIV